MKKLGLAQSTVVEDLRIGFSLNEGPWTLRLRDRRPLLHKLSPFLGTESTDNVLSAIFDADGCVLNIYSVNPDSADGYYATHVFLPSGVVIEGRELEEIIEALKVGDAEKIGLFFNKEYPDEGPQYRSRFSEIGAFRRYGSEGASLRDILSHLYTIDSGEYSEVFLLDSASPIQPDATLKDITASQKETRILTDLEPAKGSLPADEIYVNGILWEGIPVYTGPKAEVTLKKKGFADVLIKDAEVSEKGIARFVPDWKIKIDYNTFRIAGPDGENLDGYSITVNSEPVTPERSVSMPSEKAKKALVRVEKPGYQIWEKEMDLTKEVRFTLTLSKDTKTRQFFIKTLHDGKQAPLELILPDMLESSPIQGYKITETDGDHRATLTYEPLAILKDNKWKAILGGIAAGIFVLGLLLGLLLGGGKGEKTPRAPKERKAKTETVSQAAPDVKTYLDTVKVLDRAYMETLGIADLFDALNTYKAAKADSILKVYGAKGNVRELTDNMMYYAGMAAETGKSVPSRYSDNDPTLNCEKFSTVITNKIEALK